MPWRPRLPAHLVPDAPSPPMPAMGPVAVYNVDVEVIGGARSTVEVTADTPGHAHEAAIAAARIAAGAPRAGVIVHGYRRS